MMADIILIKKVAYEDRCANPRKNPYFQANNVKYSETESTKYRRDIVKRGVMATTEMNFEKEKIEKMGLKNQSGLPIHLNCSAYQYRHLYRGSRFP
jgi:hypothetical protein